jgi:hypothetical protein
VMERVQRLKRSRRVQAELPEVHGGGKPPFDRV